MNEDLLEACKVYKELKELKMGCHKTKAILVGDTDEN